MDEYPPSYKNRIKWSRNSSSSSSSRVETNIKNNEHQCSREGYEICDESEEDEDDDDRDESEEDEDRDESDDEDDDDRDESEDEDDSVETVLASSSSIAESWNSFLQSTSRVT